ncbi:hypothetical protein GGI42DRAFT_332513 [Trichoderma sp. SZMC 28013]
MSIVLRTRQYVLYTAGKVGGGGILVGVSAGTRHIMIISDARELGPSGHINGSCVRHEIARNRASDQPHSVALVGRRVSLAP